MDYKKILFSLPHCSCAMKNEIEKNGFSFSDFNIASIIYNWRLPYVEKIGLLKQIAAETSDEVLKLQINQRIDVDNWINLKRILRNACLYCSIPTILSTAFMANFRWLVNIFRK